MHLAVPLGAYVYVQTEKDYCMLRTTSTTIHKQMTLILSLASWQAGQPSTKLAQLATEKETWLSASSSGARWVC